MTGSLYVHFPYCEHHCSYCDFVVATPRTIPQRRFTDAILAELAFRGSDLGGPVQTLYFGGGTPSLWAHHELTRVITAVQHRPGIAPGAEITIEANPNEVTRERLEALKQLGINRVSLGVQSFNDSLLPGIERRHNGARAREACELIAAADFNSHSIDLIFGLPGQSLSAWRDDVETALHLAPPHLSVYGLTVEPRTVLNRQVSDGRVTLPDEAKQVEMMFAARQMLREAGYTHYEVSSYAKPGHRARHNSGYWEGRPYLALGPGAHGYLPPIRWVNIRRPRRYIDAALAGDPTATTETLDAATMTYERVMTGLRDLESGIDLSEDWERFGAAVMEQVDQGLLRLDGRRIWLTDEGLRMMNVVLLALL